MVIVVSFFLATAVMVISYALNQGGPIAGMLFLLVLLIGAGLRVSHPTRQKLKR